MGPVDHLTAVYLIDVSTFSYKIVGKLVDSLHMNIPTMQMLISDPGTPFTNMD